MGSIYGESKEMDILSDHYIVCGGGNIGQKIMRLLIKQKIYFVLIESARAKIEATENTEKYSILNADATLESNLRLAGVERAIGLVSCLSNDAQNVYVVLAARDLNQNLHIVSVANDKQAEQKLIQVCANRVISPTIIGGRSMTRALLKRGVPAFTDSIITDSYGFVFEEVSISKDSVYTNKPLKSGKEICYSSSVVPDLSKN